MAFSSRPHEASQDGAAASSQQQGSISKRHGLQMSRPGSVASGLSKASNFMPSGSVNKPFGALKRSTTQASGLSSKSGNTVNRQLLPSSRSKEDIWGSSWKLTSGSGVTSTQHRTTTPPLSPGTTKQVQPVRQRPTMTGLRSPPPLSKSLKPKRSIDASESDRPAKRPAFGRGLSSTSTFSSGLSALVDDASGSNAQEKPMFKARRSTALPSSRTSAALSSLQKVERVTENVPTFPAARRTSNIFAQSSASLAPLASSSSTLSFSPSKFGLTVPREFNFSVSPKERPKPLQAEHHNNDTKARGLAPSPLQPDEHVPRLLVSSSGSTTPQKPIQGASSDVSPGYRGGVETSLKCFDLMQRTIERNKEARVSGMIISPSRGNHTSEEIAEDGTGSMAVVQAAPPKLQLPMLPALSPSTSTAQNKPATSAFLLPSIRFHPDESEEEQPSRLTLAPALLPSMRPSPLPSSPLKRPRSPSPPPTVASASGTSRSIKPRRSMITRSLSAGEIARQATKDDQPSTKAQVSQPTIVNKRRALGHGLPRAQSSRNVGRLLAGTASTAVPPPTAAVRSVSAPVARVENMRISPSAEADDAVEVLSESAGRKMTVDAPNANANVSEDSLEMDTSIMSSSGQASLANLQSLLSRMSIPRASVSRRSSANSSTLHLLDERAEIEQDMLASRNVHPDNNNNTVAETREAKGSNTNRAVPRYAAPTTSSTARFALSYTNPGVPVRSSYAQQKQKHAEAAALGLPVPPPHRGVPTHRKISNPPPGAVRGSLLPLASSTNAAQNAIKRSSSSPTKEMDVDKPRTSVENAGETVNKPEKSTTLKNVVAFVDVKTAEGDDAGGVFVDILRSLGARVLARPTDSVTHIIYKGGRASTLTRYRAYRDPKPHLVGVGWVVACRETDTHTSEKGFMLDANGLESVLLGNAKSKTSKRKSLEPRKLLSSSTSNTSLSSSVDVFQSNVLQPVEHNVQQAPAPSLQKSSSSKSIFGTHLSASNAPQNMDIDRARRRTLQFAPKIGSPLKQRVFNAFEVDEDAFADDD